MPDLRYVRTDSFTLSVADFGGAGPAMLLLHGLGGSWTNWLAVAPTLAGEARVMAVDLPGFGSSPPGRDFRIATHVRAVLELLDTLRWDRVVLVGNSMGGLVAEMVAAAAPARVDDLVLVGPASPPPRDVRRVDLSMTGRLVSAALPVIGPALLGRRIRGVTPREQLLATLEMMPADIASIPPDVLEVGVEQTRRRRSMPWALHATSESGRDIARLFVRRDRFDAMIRSIRCGALVVVGTADKVVAPDGVRRVAALRSDWDLVELEGVGHVPMLDHARTFADLALARLRQRAGSPTGG
ncbi:MAG: alpha/beta hydrolase [Acidimicrobiia bacterium]